LIGIIADQRRDRCECASLFCVERGSLHWRHAAAPFRFANL
jgi:hypothetical protein